MHKILLLIVIILVFISGYFFAREMLGRIYNDFQAQKQNAVTVIEQKTGCDTDCQKQIDIEIARALATISATAKNTVAPQGTGTLSKPQVSYIPLDGLFSTTSTGWVDAKGIEVCFDLTKDYGNGAKVAWEASLRVANANGTAYARLFDVNHGIAIDGSEISVTNSADYQRVSSGNLKLWAGRNVYRVQLKSLNSLNVDYTGGKIRISY